MLAPTSELRNQKPWAALRNLDEPWKRSGVESDVSPSRAELFRAAHGSCVCCPIPYACAMNTLVAGWGRWTDIGGMGFRVELTVRGAGLMDGMQAVASMVCMALWLRQKEGEVPRRERAEIAMGVLLERGLWE